MTGAEIGEGEVLEMGGERTEYGQSDLTAVSTEEKCVMQYILYINNIKNIY